MNAIPRRLLIAFFAASTALCATVALSIVFPSTVFDFIWKPKPQAHADFLKLGTPGALLMAAVCAVMFTAALGLWRSRAWGWWAAVAAFSFNALSDAIRALVTSDHSELVGVPIAGFIIWYLCRPNVRRYFGIGRRQSAATGGA